MRRLATALATTALVTALVTGGASAHQAQQPRLADLYTAAGCPGTVILTTHELEAGHCTLGDGRCVVGTFADHNLGALWVSQMGPQFAGRRVLGHHWAGQCDTTAGAQLLAARLGGSAS